MKKTFLLLIALSLLVIPATASAVEFTLGGYIKMETIWDSTQTQKNLLNPGGINRNNDPNFQHGRLKMTAENSRMWFLIKGPTIWGATTTGYIEWDFDEHANVNTASGALSYGPQKARIGLRHAFFRLNWPTTELLMGQYWSLLTEEIPETANFGAVTTAGQPFERVPQIRLTQKFCDLTASVAITEPVSGIWGLSLDSSQSSGFTGAANNVYGGESSETPKFEGRVKWEADLWGKAAFWGVPRPFSVRLAAAWQRTRFRAFSFTNNRTFGQDQWAPGITGVQRDQQYLNNWLVEGSMFIPVIPTYNKSLAGTASILAQWWVGAGMDIWFEDAPNNASYLKWAGLGDGLAGNPWQYDRALVKRYGGFIQGQYYFTNEWYLNAVWGMNKAFGVPQERDLGRVTGTNPEGYTLATIGPTSDLLKINQQYNLSLWYRPIQALKFGLEYSYMRSDFFQKAGPSIASNPAQNVNVTDRGENHRLMFCGFFFF